MECLYSLYLKRRQIVKKPIFILKINTSRTSKFSLLNEDKISGVSSSCLFETVSNCQHYTISLRGEAMEGNKMSRLFWFPILCARYCDQAVCNHSQHPGPSHGTHRVERSGACDTPTQGALCHLRNTAPQIRCSALTAALSPQFVQRRSFSPRWQPFGNSPRGSAHERSVTALSQDERVASPSPLPRRHKMCRGVPSLRAGQHYCLASCSALGGATPLPDNEGSCHHYRLDSSVQRRRVISTSSRASIQNPASGSPSAAWLEDCRDNR